MSDAGQFRLAGPVTVLCSAQTVGAAGTLMRHLYSAGAVIIRRPAPPAGGRSAPWSGFEADHIEPFADWLSALAPAGRRLPPVAPSRQ